MTINDLKEILEIMIKQGKGDYIVKITLDNRYDWYEIYTVSVSDKRKELYL